MTTVKPFGKPSDSTTVRVECGMFFLLKPHDKQKLSMTEKHPVNRDRDYYIFIERPYGKLQQMANDWKVWRELVEGPMPHWGIKFKTRIW